MEFSISMKLKIGDDLHTVHTSQLVYSNHQDLCSDPLPDEVILAGSEICKTDGDHQNIKIVAVPILCNTYVQLN